MSYKSEKRTPEGSGFGDDTQRASLDLKVRGPIYPLRGCGPRTSRKRENGHFAWTGVVAFLIHLSSDAAQTIPMVHLTAVSTHFSSGALMLHTYCRYRKVVYDPNASSIVQGTLPVMPGALGVARFSFYF